MELSVNMQGRGSMELSVNMLGMGNMEFSANSLWNPLLLLLLLLLKKIGNARLGEGDCHPISPKTPAPHYQPIEEKKRKGK